MLWVEDIRGWRVIHDGHPVQVATEPLQIFDVVSPVEDARLAEQPRPEHAPLVQKVSHGVSVLRAKVSSGQIRPIGPEGQPRGQRTAGRGQVRGQPKSSLGKRLV